MFKNRMLVTIGMVEIKTFPNNRRFLVKLFTTFSKNKKEEYFY